MASRTSFKLEGIAELRQALAEFGEEVATKVGARANLRAAQKMRDALVAAAPHAPGVQLKTYTAKSGAVRRTDYGDLRDNIRVSKRKAKKEHHIVHDVTTGNAFWGMFQEFGTSRQPAYPWMRPTFDANASAALDEQISELKSGIDREAKKAARKAKRGG